VNQHGSWEVIRRDRGRVGYNGRVGEIERSELVGMEGGLLLGVEERVSEVVGGFSLLLGRLVELQSRLKSLDLRAIGVDLVVEDLIG
jgi:hypothetical protein